MATVSIIIATYNQADYLADAVESVLNQTFADWELVVIDDGSTDRTASVLAGLAAAHSGRFRTLRQDNAGVGAAMNLGLSETAAPLVAFLDSDDTWDRDHLATLVPMLTADRSAVLAFGRRDVMDASGRRIDRPGKPFHAGRVTTELFRSMFISKICVLARREAIERAGRFDTALRMGEDYELLLRLSRLGEFVAADRIVAHRRRHASNLTADTPCYRVRTAALLERFYFRLEGWRDVDRSAARARLARAHYSAGRKLLAARDGAAARFHLTRSVAFAPTAKSRLLLVLATLSGPAARRQGPPIPTYRNWGPRPPNATHRVWSLRPQAGPVLPEGYEFIPTDEARRILARA